MPVMLHQKEGKVKCHTVDSVSDFCDYVFHFSPFVGGWEGLGARASLAVRLALLPSPLPLYHSFQLTRRVDNFEILFHGISLKG